MLLKEKSSRETAGSRSTTIQTVAAPLSSSLSSRPPMVAAMTTHTLATVAPTSLTVMLRGTPVATVTSMRSQAAR